jgi:hypothetical protein
MDETVAVSARTARLIQKGSTNQHIAIMPAIKTRIMRLLAPRRLRNFDILQDLTRGRPFFIDKT